MSPDFSCKRSVAVVISMLFLLSLPLYGIPKVEDGVLRLTDADLAGDRLVDLSGNWEFWHLRLISPGEPKSDGYRHVPGSWDRPEGGDKPLPPEGYVTCRFRVEFPDAALRSLFCDISAGS
jgi:hypothetical protein